MFIRPGFSAGVNVRSPSATSATVKPSASAADVAARAFSTLTRLNPASVIGTSVTSTTGSGSLPGRSTAIQPSSTVVTRPPASITARPFGESGSRVNTQTGAFVPSRMAKVRGSSAFSTHHPVGLVILVITAFTSASWSSVSMPPRPRWSAEMLVTTETSLNATPTPRRRIPPRAVSVTASSIPGYDSTRPAPLGPE